MAYSVKTDIVPLLKNLIKGLNTFAIANGVSLRLEIEKDIIELEYRPETIVPDLTQLVCQVVTYTPQDHDVFIQVLLSEASGNAHLHIKVFNNSTSLSGYRMIVHGIKSKLNVYHQEEASTIFELLIPTQIEEATTNTHKPLSNSNYKGVPEFYKKLRKQFFSYYSSIPNLEKAAQARSHRDGIFLKKLNVILLANIDKEGFEVGDLAKALALSRSQLYRRLKPLIGFSPAHYIKYVRLQKAKEFLENGEGNIGDAAFHVGFVSQSHFTRAFKEQFGFNPSHISKQHKSTHLITKKPNL